MIPAYNKKRCAAFPFETGIHSRRKTDFIPEEDTTKSYSGFEPEPTRFISRGMVQEPHKIRSGSTVIQEDYDAEVYKKDRLNRLLEEGLGYH
ncbi:poly polymerase [Trichonephila clavipes]|nr:poly polymerase [Trichonephila clavipes]